MTLLQRSPWAPEELDRTGHDPDVLAASLAHVTGANDWLGGTRSIVRALSGFLRDARGPLTLLDIGTGSGEVLQQLVRAAADRGATIRPVGLDANAESLEVARRLAPTLPLLQGDARALPFPDASIDFVVATLILHHVPDDAQAQALREMARVAKRAVIIGELERNVLHWIGARLLAATLWRRNPLTRHDAPVSVRRGYTPKELESLAAACGLEGHARRFPIFRIVLTVIPAPRRAT